MLTVYYLPVLVQYLHIYEQYLHVPLYLADAGLRDEELHIGWGQQGDITERRWWWLIYQNQSQYLR